MHPPEDILKLADLPERGCGVFMQGSLQGPSVCRMAADRHACLGLSGWTIPKRARSQEEQSVRLSGHPGASSVGDLRCANNSCESVKSLSITGGTRLSAEPLAAQAKKENHGKGAFIYFSMLPTLNYAIL